MNLMRTVINVNCRHRNNLNWDIYIYVDTYYCDRHQKSLCQRVKIIHRLIGVGNAQFSCSGIPLSDNIVECLFDLSQPR